MESPPNGPYGSSCFSSCCPHSLCLIFSIHSWRLHCLTRKSYLSFRLEWLNPWHIHLPTPDISPILGCHSLCGWQRPSPCEGSAEVARSCSSNGWGHAFPVLSTTYAWFSSSALLKVWSTEPWGSPRHFQGSTKSKYFIIILRHYLSFFSMLTFAQWCKGIGG